MFESGTAQAGVIALALFILLVGCSLFKSRSRPGALTPDQIDDIRIRRESTKEATLEAKAHKLKERARMHRHNRLVLSARKKTDNLLQGAQEQWDARGRSIYGDAWDCPEDGSLPLRTLFNLPKEEIDFMRDEASRLLQAEWPREAGFSSLPTPPSLSTSATFPHDENYVCEERSRLLQGSGKDEQRARTASARRGYASSRPPIGAPYLDTRFVHATTPPIIPLLDFTNLNKKLGSSSIAQTYVEGKQPRFPTSAGVGNNPENSGTSNRTRFVDGLQPPPQRFHYTNGPPSLIAAVPSSAAGHAGESPKLAGRENVPIFERASFQAPGLSHPRPPDVPPPTITKCKGSTVGSGRDTLSARLARLAVGGSSSRVVPLQLV